jgi:iron(III) transport system permease protein
VTTTEVVTGTEPASTDVVAGAPPGRFRGARLRPGHGGSRGFAVVAALPAVAILGLLGAVLWISVRVSVATDGLTLDHYHTVFGDPFAYRALLNTAGFTVVATATALVLGLPLAWLVERTDLRGKSAIYTLATIGVFIPGFFTAMGWALFLHPRIGMANQWLMQWFDLDTGPIDITSVGGMGVVQGFGMSGLVFVFTGTSLRSMDGSLEEAAAMSGGSTRTVLRRITGPLAWPGILAALLFVITLNISAFDVPLLLGLPNRIYTFSTFLVTLMSTSEDGLPPYGVIAAFGSLMIVVAVALSLWYRRMSVQARRYVVLTGKGSPRKVVKLGRWRYLAWGFLAGYFGLAQVMPLVLLIWTAFLPYFQPISADAFHHLGTGNFSALPWPLVRRGATNTALLMLAVPLLTFALSVAISWVVLRSRSRMRAVVDFVAFLPVAVPSVVFGFAALLTVLNVGLPFGIELYGTLTLLILMYALVSLGFGTRTTTTALIQIDRELEEAAMMSGASHGMTVRRIVVPLLLPAIVYGSLWVALLVSRDITLATILFSGENITVPMVVWTVWNEGQMGQASALCLLGIAVFVPLIYLYLRRAGGQAFG